MKRWFAVLALASAPIATSCAFLLDFDDLQGGDGSAGSDGGKSCTADPECNDDNPCTEDRCDLTSNTCVNDARVVVRDGEPRTMDVAVAHRVSVVASGARYYVAAFTEDELQTPDVPLYWLDIKTDTWTPVGSLQSASPQLNDFPPTSNAALVVDTSGGVEVHAYVALLPDPGQPGRVYHARMDASLAVQAAEQTDSAFNYGLGHPERMPVTWQLADNKIYGAWVSPTGSIFFHALGPLPELTELTVDPPAEIVAPAGIGSTPALFWVSDTLHAGLPNKTPGTIPECGAGGGAWVSAQTSFIEYQNTWLASWTRQGANKQFVSELGTFGCSDTANLCAGPPAPACDPSPVRPDTRDVAAQFYRRPSEPTLLYQILAIPTVDVGGNTAALGLTLREVDTEPDGGAVKPLDERVLSTTVVGTNTAGPDWPAVAVADPEHFAVAWVEPGAQGGRQSVRLERFRVCYDNVK